MPLGVPVSPAPPGSLLSATAVTDTVGGGIVSVSVANPTVIGFAADHGLQSGASITIAGTSTTPATVGTFVVTVPAGSTNAVTIPVAVTVVTTGTGTATVKALQQQVGVPGVAQDGTDASGVTPPTGAVGIRGWLSGIYSKLSAALAVTQSGTWTVATNGADGSQATIGNTADANSATTLVGLLKAIKAAITGTVTVSGTVTANAGTNTSTSALATESGGNLATIAGNTGKIPALGQAAMAASAPVTIANNQSAVPISAASLPLPTGALAAAQLPATLGQKNMAGSASVTLANDQSAVPTTLATAPALVAGEAHIGALGGATVAVSGSVTRPANTTSYSAGQVVGTASTDVIAIAGAARKTGGSGVILDALIVDQGGAAASAALELYLFTAPPTVQADQVALALVAADLAALVAVVPVASSYVTNVAATISGSRAYPVPGVNAGFVCAGGSTTLYGVLVQRSAYTPISAESYTVTLLCAQD